MQKKSRSSSFPTRRPGRSTRTTKARHNTKSLSHNVRNAGSFLGFVVRAPHAPSTAEQWRGGDGSERSGPTATDDLGNSGRPVVDRAACPAPRGVAALARASLDSPAPHPRRDPLRAPHGMSVEGRAALVCVRFDGVDVAVGRHVAPQGPAGWGKKQAPTRPTARSPGPSATSSPTAAACRSPSRSPERTRLTWRASGSCSTPASSGPRPARSSTSVVDKGYDYVVVERAVRQRRFQPHIRPGGEEQRACRRGTRARRWVVERTHSWFNRYRKLLIRWEKKPQNYLALVQFAAVLIVWRLVG